MIQLACLFNNIIMQKNVNSEKSRWGERSPQNFSFSSVVAKYIRANRRAEKQIDDSQKIQ